MASECAARFWTVVLDMDSTLAGVEGIDWLAKRRSPELATEIAALTSAAMAGQGSIEDMYARRLKAVAPSERDITALAEAYRAAVAPGARECVGAFARANVRALVVSGGVRAALLPLARDLGVADADVYGVGLSFAADGTYAGFDTQSPLTRGNGKSQLLAEMIDSLARPMLHVGDGMTDAVTRDVVDAFAVFTGFVRREAVVARADYIVDSFDALRRLVLG